MRHLIAAVLFLAACSDDPAAGGDTTTTTTDTTATTTTDSTPDVTAGSCTPLTSTWRNETSPQVDAVEATLVNGAGQPLIGVAVQVCGIELCFAGTSGADGHVSIAVNHALTRPALRFGDGRHDATLAVPLGVGTSSLGTIVDAALPDVGATIAPGNVTSNGLTLRVAADTTVTIDTLTYGTEQDQQLRAAPLTLSAILMAPSGATLGWGLGPPGTELCPPASMTVPNSQHWPAGSAVELDLHGTDVSQYWAPFGGWAPLSDGTVSPDGTTITFDYVPVLGTFALRRKP